eukprot:4780268-Pyramimonas_sp.AAC.1
MPQHFAAIAVPMPSYFAFRSAIQIQLVCSYSATTLRIHNCSGTTHILRYTAPLMCCCTTSPYFPSQVPLLYSCSATALLRLL